MASEKIERGGQPVVEGGQIGVYRSGALPPDPTKNPFEKGFLDFLKLSKNIVT